MERVVPVIFVFLAALPLRAAETPKEAVGFSGLATGTIKSVQADGKSFTLTVTAAKPDERSTIKDPKPMIGKIISLGTRMPKTDGLASNHPDDVAYIKALKPGDTIAVTVFAVNADPKILRIISSGPLATQPASKPATQPTAPQK